MIGGQAVRALGAMSGTSLDGVDAAEIVTDGETIASFGPAGYRPYSAEEREVIRAALGCWPGEAGVAEAPAPRRPRKQQQRGVWFSFVVHR